MDSIVRNAFRILNLPPGAPLPDVRARVAEYRKGAAALSEAPFAINDAMRRIEDPVQRLHETIFGGGPVPGGRPEAAARLERLVREGGTVDAWTRAHREWQEIAKDPSFANSVASWASAQGGSGIPSTWRRSLSDLPVSLLLVTIQLGREALTKGDVATAKTHAQVIAAAAPDPGTRSRALAALQREAVDKSLEAMSPIVQGLEFLESARANDRARLEALVAQAGAIAGPAAARLDEFAPGSADELRDAHAQVLRRAALLNLRLGGGAEATVKWQEEAAREARSEDLKAFIEQDRAEPGIAIGLMNAAALARSGKVEKARAAVIQLLSAAKSAEGKARVQRWLDEPQLLVAPMGSAPPLARLNGFGVGLYGRSRESGGAYVSTLCLSALFLPVFPLCSYLVSDEPGGYRFYGRVPLTGFARWGRRVSAVAAALLVFAVVRAATHNEARENQLNLLARAEELEKSGQHRQAIECLYVPSTSDDSEILRRAGVVARAAAAGELQSLKDPEGVIEFVKGGSGRRLWSFPATGRRGWFDDSLYGEVEACLERVAWPELPDPAVSTADADRFQALAQAPRDLIDWAAQVQTDSRGLRARAAVKFCEKHAWPPVQAAAIAWSAPAQPPADLVASLGRELERLRYPGWKGDALIYLGAAPAEAARPVLFLRARDAWLGRESGDDLRALRDRLPRELAALLEAGAQPDLENRVARLEAVRSTEGLPEAVRPWHTAGVERRLAVAYNALNDADPAKYPIALAVPHAIASADLFPDDPDITVLALQGLLATGDAERAISIGRRAPDVPAVRVWLGVACARAGKLDEAVAILDPFVAQHFAPFVEAWNTYEKQHAECSKQFWAQLQNGGNQALIQRLNSLSAEAAQKEAEAWVESSVANLPHIRSLGDRIREHSGARVAARELAMVRLARGRALPAGTERETELGKCETLFRDLRKVSGGDDTEDLALVQVYLWLGRNEEADKLVSKLELSTDGEILTSLGEALREVGRRDGAARVLEKAWGLLGDPQRNRAASLRALVANSIEDRLVWLSKCPQDEPYIAAVTAEAKARLLLEAGKGSEAVPLLAKAAEYWERHPDDDGALNNAGVNYQIAFTATGDVAHLLKALKVFRQALALNPENPILVTNTVSSLSNFGWAALAGDALRASVLHETPRGSWAAYVVPALSEEEWKKRFSSQAELREAADLGERAALLAPDEDGGFDAQLAFAVWTGDAPRLRKMLAAIEAAPPARPEEAEKNARHSSGEFSEEERKSLTEGLKAAEDTVARARILGHVPTLAYALARLSEVQGVAVFTKLPGVTVDAEVATAREAMSLADNSDTRSRLADALLSRAAQRTAVEDAGFASLFAEVLDAEVSLWSYSRRNSAFASKAAQIPEVREAGDLALRSFGDGISPPGISAVMRLSLIDHPKGAEALRLTKTRGTALDSAVIRVMLNPGSPSSVARAWATAVLLGDTAVEARIARNGTLPHLFGK